MYAGDFGGDGRTEQILTCYNGNSAYPMLLRHDLVAVLPALKKRYLKYESYCNQTINNVFSKEQLKGKAVLKATIMQSSVFINNTKGTFTTKPLPWKVQLSTMYGVAVEDFDGDEKQDILMGDTFTRASPKQAIYDASYGALLKAAALTSKVL